MTYRILSVLLIALAACAPGAEVEGLPSPAGEGSGEPYLSSVGDGVVMSWLQRSDAGGHDMWVARLTEEGWSPASLVTHGDDLFVNWADFPSVVQGGDGSLWGHWLQRKPGTGLAYDILVSRSTDGGPMRTAPPPSTDSSRSFPRRMAWA